MRFSHTPRVSTPKPQIQAAIKSVKKELPALEKMEHSTADEILRTCKNIFEAQPTKPRCIFFKNIKIEGPAEEVWDGIRRLYNDSEAGAIGKLRLTSTALIDIIVELMPHASHEAFSNGFGYALNLSFNEITKGQEADEADFYFGDAGSQTVKLDHPNKCFKQADKCFVPADANHQDPSVVIEVGRSETIKELRGDMSRWFFKASVKMVILLEIGAKVLVEKEESPTLTLELWKKHWRCRNTMAST